MAEETRWRRRPEERPAQIVESALVVFGESGLAGARLEEIAQRAGISKGTIYQYFDSKDALFREVVQRTVVDAMEFMAGVERRGSAEERLRQLAAEFWEYLRTPGFQTVYRLVLGELHHFPELAKDYSEQVSGRIRGVVESLLVEGVERGEFRPQRDARATARMLIGLLVTHALWCERRELFRHLASKSDAEVLTEVLEFYLDAVRPRCGE